MLIYRISVRGILTEIAFPKENPSREAIILCDGLPATPKQRELMETLVSRGFFVAYPRYRGTWESDGVFLEHSPAKDIIDIAETIQKGESLRELYSQENFSFSIDRVYVLGVSFGASVALAVSPQKVITRVVAIAPIIDFKNFSDSKYKNQDLHFLGNFLRRGFPHVYRFEDSRWEALCRGEIFSPISGITPVTALKTVVLFGGNDTVVHSKHGEDILNKKGITYRTIPNLSHPSLSSLSHSSILDISLQWLEKTK